jgi:ribonuclease E
MHGDDGDGTDASARDGVDAGEAGTGEGRSGRRGGRRRGRRGSRRNEEGTQEMVTEGAATPEHPHVSGPTVERELDFSRDAMHPEKPDYFEPAPKPHHAAVEAVARPSIADAPVVAETPFVEAAPFVEATPAAQAPAVAEVVAKETPVAVAPVETPKPRRAEPVSSAPVLERVVVSMDGTPATTPAAASDDKPVRKGWWQRKLAGE